MYLCHISLCLQTLTEQVSLASLALHRHKVQRERGEPPVHPGTAMTITFKGENTLPESCSTCFIQSTKTDSSASGSVVMVVPGSLQH